MARYYSSDPPPLAHSRLEVRRYQVRGKILAIGDQFKIKDERDNDLFIVKSKLLSIGDTLILEDTNGK